VPYPSTMTYKHADKLLLLQAEKKKVQGRV